MARRPRPADWRFDRIPRTRARADPGEASVLLLSPSVLSPSVLIHPQRSPMAADAPYRIAASRSAPLCAICGCPAEDWGRMPALQPIPWIPHLSSSPCALLWPPLPALEGAAPSAPGRAVDIRAFVPCAFARAVVSPWPRAPASGPLSQSSKAPRSPPEVHSSAEVTDGRRCPHQISASRSAPLCAICGCPAGDWSSAPILERVRTSRPFIRPARPAGSELRSRAGP